MSVTLVWWLFIEALGLAGAPLAATVLRKLPDRGWALSKPLSLLTLGWLVWFPLSLDTALPFSRGWLIGAALVFVAGNVALLVFVPATREALLRLAREAWDYIALTEAIFAIAYALMTWVHSFTPAVADTEKFMDEAFLAAIWRAPHLPPPDPWLSGYSINYYYFGHFLMALIAKLLDTAPALAFNLAVGLVFALAAVAIFGVASNMAAVARGERRSLTPAALAGALSVLLTLIAGNFNGAQVWMQNALQAAKTNPALHVSVWAWWTHRELWPTYDWWSPSRVAPNTINEFPAFSFILADLHAHVLALPFAALAVGLAFNLLLSRERGFALFGARLWPLGLIVCGLALGGLYVINGWDLPTYLGIALLALAIQQWLAHERTISRALLLDVGRCAGVLVALVFLLYLPFYLTFSSPSEGVGLVPSDLRTPIGYEWDIFALPAFIALSYLALRLGPWLTQVILPDLAETIAPGGAERLSRRLVGIPGAALAGALLLVWTWLSWLTRQSVAWTLFWAVVVIALCAALVIWWTDLHTLVMGAESSADGTVRAERVSRADMMVTLLIGTAAALIGGCEVVFLRDVFSGGPLGAPAPDFRMNTVFKFYYQVWLLLGVISGPLLIWLANAIWRAALRAVATPVVASVHAPITTAVAATPALAIAHASGDDDAFTVTRAPLDDAPAHPSGLALRRATASDVIGRVMAFGGSGLWIVVFLWLLLAALVYPTLAVAARSQNLGLPRSLDGTAYMAQDANNMGDAQAIAWLNTHVSGDPIIVEAAKYDEYTHLGRVSAFTGLPTLIGWGGHEEQWRYNWLATPGRANVLSERLNVVKLIYTNTNNAFVLSLLRSYHVRYVYVGAAERQTYGQQVDHFSTFLTRVYQQAGVTIYEVPGA
ncbi:MAG TPA: DUF2298 domain-containing protein [Ktedonobacterales bacterium]|jgi:YYY domain-containing protein|nr:DUF2298 domain-containing protein [Ktedonobacterales bacterium]